MTSNDRPGTAADMMYTYDTLHGWVKEISSPSGFNELLLRENATNAQFSGNIGSIQWKNTKKGELHQYDYTYDSLGRLIDSQYSSSTMDNNGNFNETVEYNSNGSITKLLRRGMKNDGTFGLIDNLEINYDGNRLLNVEDRAESLNYNGAQDFHDGASTTCEYDYDCNGALTRDGNRGISSISYDFGHHPQRISMSTMKGWSTIGSSNNIINDYTPDGRKLSSIHTTSSIKGRTIKETSRNTDLYIDGLILRNGKPQMWQFGGGYVELDDNGTPTSWNYYITDHLGSTRMVVDSNNNIKETINYYPFGSEMRMENPALMVRNNKKISMETAGFAMPSDSAVNIKEPGILMPIDSVAKGNEPALAYEDYWQRYRFSGKELDKQNGLNMYDFGARLFDVAGVPMWTSVDPLAEKFYPFTPYNYCAGDPVNKIDPDGKSTKVKTKEDGTYQVIGGDINDKDRNIYVYTQDENGDYSIKGESIGISATPTSFYNSDKKDPSQRWGGIINPNDNSGKKFLNNIMGENSPNLLEYMYNAQTNHKYDFKVTNGTDSKINGINPQRGMPISTDSDGNVIYASARDIGNMAAGYMAAKNGISWKAARKAFDMYQGSPEGRTTVNAELYGYFVLGYNTTAQKLSRQLKKK